MMGMNPAVSNNSLSTCILLIFFLKDNQEYTKSVQLVELDDGEEDFNMVSNIPDDDRPPKWKPEKTRAPGGNSTRGRTTTRSSA